MFRQAYSSQVNNMLANNSLELCTACNSSGLYNCFPQAVYSSSDLHKEYSTMALDTEVEYSKWVLNSLPE